MTNKIHYADEIGYYTLRRKEPKSKVATPWCVRMPGQNKDGYGRKITTDVVLKFSGERRERRVYATCFSNVTSHWITYLGRTYYLRDLDSVES